MDSPTNLIVVNAIMWTDEPLDWDLFRSQLAEFSGWRTDANVSYGQSQRRRWCH